VTIVCVLVAACGAAAAWPPAVEAASLELSWQAPTTDAAGAPLYDLAGYRVYVTTSSPACGAASAIDLASPVSAPSPGETVTHRVNGLALGTTYSVAVSAVDFTALESECTPEATGVAQAAFTVTPASVDFGATLVGTSVDRTFTIQNPSPASVSLTVSAPAAFTLVSGPSYAIAPGESQDIVVRFSPTEAATFSGNITFSADGDTLSRPVTATAATALLSLAYSGKLRDRVGPGNLGIGADDAMDGTLTATLSAIGGRTITRLKLQSSAPGTWDTDPATSAWVLGASTGLDTPLLNDPATMAVQFAIADGGTFRVFAADFADIEFVPGTTLTLIATFSDGTTATGVTIATAVPPSTPPSLALSYDGKLRDRVAPGNVGLGADGHLDGTFTATLSAPGGRTVTRLRLTSSAPGTWDTDGATSAWVVGAASTLDGPLVNDPVTAAVDLAVADGGSFRVFAADFADIEFVPGTTLTLTATFSDGTTVSAATVATAVTPPPPPSLGVVYNGKLRDRIGPGNLGLGPDGEADGTLTVTLTAAGGRTITRLTLQSSAPGTWDTEAATSAWILGAATSLNSPLLNAPGTAAVSFAVADGGSFQLFAADYANIEFVPGTTLRVTAVFDDGTIASASTVAGAGSPAPSLAVTYDGKLRDRVGPGSVGVGEDGEADGTFTVTLTAAGGRTITRVTLHSSAPGTWDTDAATSAWVLGVAADLDAALLNDPVTMAVAMAVADGGSFRLFAADYANIEFVSGTTLTVTADFSDGTTARGSLDVP
jgi:hypothetical protein